MKRHIAIAAMAGTMFVASANASDYEAAGQLITEVFQCKAIDGKISISDVIENRQQTNRVIYTVFGRVYVWRPKIALIDEPPNYYHYNYMAELKKIPMGALIISDIKAYGVCDTDKCNGESPDSPKAMEKYNNSNVTLLNCIPSITDNKRTEQKNKK